MKLTENSSLDFFDWKLKIIFRKLYLRNNTIYFDNTKSLSNV